MRSLIYILFANLGLLLSACGNADGENGHPHEGEAAHSHAAEESAAVTDAEHGHAHDENSQSTHGATETKAYYAGEAEGVPADTTTESDAHGHGDDTHEHVGDNNDVPDHEAPADDNHE